jgi:SAM-dependent methyltransferase
MKMNKKESIEKLNLGCGSDIRKDYLNLDFIKCSGVNLVYDINKLPLPFKENTFKEILMFNILEHVLDPWQLMCEIHRISKKDGIIRIITPHFSSGNTWADMQHKRPFSYLCFTHKNIIDKFEVVNNVIDFPKRSFWFKWFANKFPGFYEYNLAYIFRCGDLHVTLKVKK